MAGLSEQTAARQAHVAERLRLLGTKPPQSLLMEGGAASERLELALFWAMLLNCIQTPPGCGLCSPCRQILDRVLRDLHVFDGAEGSIKIDDVRELRPVWGQPPHGEGFRVTIFHEAQALTPESANALLKSLEEPRPGNVFVLLAPQRERLLPTLVSRSFILTLAWPDPLARDEEADPWVQAMVEFWGTGGGWFERTAAKGALDRPLALRIHAALSRDLRSALAGSGTEEGMRLAAALGPERLRVLDLALGETQDALNAQVNPAICLDWLASRLARV